MASTYLTKTFAGAGSTTTWTWSAWIKKSGSSAQQLLSAAPSSVDDQIYFSSDQLIFYTGNQVSLKTNRKFRDTSAWYHIVVQWNTPDATADDRHKIWVNGVQETSFETRNNPSQNANSKINGAGQHAIGAVSSSPSEYFDGSMSHVHFIDGTAYDASAFGETDATTGIWKPKTAPSVTYGTNGFFLKFENSGSMGTDSSGNGNNFTVNGTPTQTVDTPSNVFNTWSPLIGSSYQTLTNGNLTTTGNTTADNGNVYSTLAVSKGKYYAEFKMVNPGSYPYLGIANMDKAGYYGLQNSVAGITYSANVAPNMVYSGNGQVYSNNTALGLYTSLSNGDILGIAIDLDNGAFYASVNGTFVNSGDPTSGASKTGAVGTWTPADTLYTFGCSTYSTTAINANFGNGYFGTTPVSSAENPDDGVGIFEHSVPTGYKALCTKSINAQEYA